VCYSLWYNAPTMLPATTIFCLIPSVIGASVARMQDILVAFNKEHDTLQCYISTVYVRHNVENLNNRLFRQSFGLASFLYICYMFRSIKACRMVQMEVLYLTT